MPSEFAPRTDGFATASTVPRTSSPGPGTEARSSLRVKVVDVDVAAINGDRGRDAGQVSPVLEVA